MRKKLLIVVSLLVVVAVGGLLYQSSRPSPYEDLYVTCIYFADSHRASSKLAAEFYLEDIAQALAAAGNLDKALNVANSMEDICFRVLTLQKIAMALAEAKKPDQANQVLEQALEAANSLTRMDRIPYLGGIAEALAATGNFDRALAVTNSIELSGPSINPHLGASSKSQALTEIALALTIAGESERAERVFKDALNAANSITHAYAKAQALRRIIVTLAKAEMLPKALDVGKSIQDPDNAALITRGIAVALAEAGEFDRALSVSSSIEDRIERSKALLEIAEALVDAGNFGQALDVAHSMEIFPERRRTGKPVALRQVALALAKAGERQRANEVFDEALVLADSMENHGEKGQLAGALVEAGEFDKALNVAKRFEDETCLHLIKCKLRTHAFLRISIEALSNGKGNSQAEYANKIMTAFKE